MKKYCIAVLLLCFSTGLLAQGPALTKDETVNYINKKLTEVVDQLYMTSVPKGNKYLSNYISLNGEKMSVYMSHAQAASYCPGGTFGKYTESYVFNPAHISTVSSGPGTHNSSVRTLEIKFSNNSPRYQMLETECVPNGNRYSEQTYRQENKQTSTVIIYFLETDGSTVNKLKKAFEHLRDLCKAEDDPFGN